MNDETIALLNAARSDPVTRGIVLSNNPGVTLRDVLRDGIAALAAAPSPAPVPPNPLAEENARLRKALERAATWLADFDHPYCARSIRDALAASKGDET